MSTSSSAVFTGNPDWEPLDVVSAADSSFVLRDGRKIYNASCGAAVNVLGYLYCVVTKAISKLLTNGLFYIPSAHFRHQVVEDFAQMLIDTTDGKMSKVQFYSSGCTECMISAIKLARQNYLVGDQKEEKRVNFIGRWGSYHGSCPTTLALGSHAGRRRGFEPYFSTSFHHIDQCHGYRDCGERESTNAYVARLMKKFRDKIEELGADTVCAIVVEPVVGAALGCAPAEQGYLKGLRKLCDEFGILLIYDEIMCGMGRTGTLHAWQYEGVVPDIQVVGKGLAAGFFPISAMLVGSKVVSSFNNTKFFYRYTF
ncbi:2,2-dialkylglycine decarboxylase [Lophiotrema nucula]|uniref:2,2-dialkylglycine decarboxylase n=1 Tax=Lophiotrema nucula TaxID=690887 RepID=A0A6A5YGB9_9PLEO|nr:2,2-dialkylglycine decarboxylase [Lophiotrema nucula]